MDYGCIQGYDHRGYINSQYYDVKSGRIMHGDDNESQIAYGFETKYGLDKRSYDFLYDHYREDYDIDKVIILMWYGHHQGYHDSSWDFSRAWIL